MIDKKCIKDYMNEIIEIGLKINDVEKLEYHVGVIVKAEEDSLILKNIYGIKIIDYLDIKEISHVRNTH